jgi:hypothetical protein
MIALFYAFADFKTSGETKWFLLLLVFGIIG